MRARRGRGSATRSAQHVDDSRRPGGADPAGRRTDVRAGRPSRSRRCRRPGAVAWKTVVPLVQTATPVPSPASAIVYVPTGAPAAVTSPDCRQGRGAPAAAVAVGFGAGAGRRGDEGRRERGRLGRASPTGRRSRSRCRCPRRCRSRCTPRSHRPRLHVGSSADVASAYCRTARRAAPSRRPWSPCGRRGRPWASGTAAGRSTRPRAARASSAALLEVTIPMMIATTTRTTTRR